MMDAIAALLLVSIMGLTLLPTCLWIMEKRQAVVEELTLLYELEEKRLQLPHTEGWLPTEDKAIVERCAKGYVKKQEWLCVYALAQP
ncbi:hypothetical protein [Shouchella lehensis]|uniref:hypothetical protein n=1 Tax=Shouchella lehensis TaxID=300825 RepID=UPI0018CF2549|nr:hypothetical protein [Shouchella lehensis]